MLTPRGAKSKGAVLFFCLLLIVAGCAKKPQTKIAPPSAPAIPAPINKGAGVEPELLVYFHEKGTVKSMPIEEYLQGVVAGEMEPDWPENALAAQAILARTFTLEKIAEKGKLENRNAHASTDEKEFQAYDASKINDRIKNAVEKTRGKVLVYDDAFIKAWFHAYSGGKTATARDGLSYTQTPTPYIQSIDDSQFDPYIPPEVKTWKAEFSLDTLRSAVKEATGNDPGKITSLAIGATNASGRVDTLKINALDVPANALRMALGSTVFRSTMLTEAKITRGKAVFAGKGYGHGVGMSQWGARVMAEQGKSPEEIAQYYFRNVRLVDLW